MPESTTANPVEILDSAIPVREAPEHEYLGKIWKTEGAANSAAKRRHFNGLDDYQAVLKINDRLHFVPVRVASWAVERGMDRRQLIHGRESRKF